jgi:hypothetical protein
MALGDFARSQLHKLNSEGDAFVYCLGLVTILFTAVRSSAKKLYVFTSLTFILQVFYLLEKGFTTRAGTFYIFFSMYICLICIVLKYMMTAKVNNKHVVNVALGSLFVLYLIVSIPFGGLYKSITKEGYAKSKIVMYRLDRRDFFKELQPRTVIISDTRRGRSWTKSCALKMKVHLLNSKDIPKYLKTNDPFSASIDVINSSTLPANTRFFACWRMGPPRAELFPQDFEDSSHTRYKLIKAGVAPMMTVGLYEVVKN